MRRMLAPALLPVGMVMAASFAGALIAGRGAGRRGVDPSECAGVEVREAESGDESGQPVQPAVGDAIGEVAGAGGGDGGIGVGRVEGADAADAGDEPVAAAGDVFGGVSGWRWMRRG